MKKYYRFLSGKRGIYAAVDQDCPRSDSRRANKPDGSWVPKEYQIILMAENITTADSQLVKNTASILLPSGSNKKAA